MKQPAERAQPPHAVGRACPATKVLEFHKSVNGPARRTLDTAIGWPSYLDNPLLFLVSMASLAPQLVCTADVNKRSVKLKDAFNLAAAVAVLRGCKGKVLILCKLVGIATEADGDIARPLRAAHTAEGWTAESILERVLPAFEPSMYALDRTADVFSWDPV